MLFATSIRDNIQYGERWCLRLVCDTSTIWCLHHTAKVLGSGERCKHQSQGPGSALCQGVRVSEPRELIKCLTRSTYTQAC